MISMPTVQVIQGGREQKTIFTARTMLNSGYRWKYVSEFLKLPTLDSIRVEWTGTNCAIDLSVERLKEQTWRSGDVWPKSKKQLSVGTSYHLSDFAGFVLISDRNTVFNVEIRATDATWNHSDLVLRLFFRGGSHYERIQLKQSTSGTGATSGDILFTAQFQMPNARGWPRI